MKPEDGKVIKWLRRILALEGLGLIPRAHIRQLMTLSNSNSREFDVLLWPPQVLNTCDAHTFRHTHT